MKPGKPLCLAAVGRKPVVVLPGFPTSAVFTFHEFAAPVIRALAGLPPRPDAVVDAALAVRTPSEVGRKEYVMVKLAKAPVGGLVAWPVGKGLGQRRRFRAGGRVLRCGRAGARDGGGQPATGAADRRHSGQCARPDDHRQPLRGARRGARSTDGARDRGAHPRRRQPRQRRQPGGGANATSRRPTCWTPRRGRTMLRSSSRVCVWCRAGGGCRASCSGPATRASKAWTGRRRCAGPSPIRNACW
jgi:hypothetical protein